MNTLSILLFPALMLSTAIAADPPAIPEASIAKKKELLLSDDFEGAEPAKVRHKVVPTFAVEKGTLKGTQTRDQKAHAAVHGLEIPTKDSVVEVEFDDRIYTVAHYRHLCRAQVRLNGVTIIDQRNG